MARISLVAMKATGELPPEPIGTPGRLDVGVVVDSAKRLSSVTFADGIGVVVEMAKTELSGMNAAGLLPTEPIGTPGRLDEIAVAEESARRLSSVTFAEGTGVVVEIARTELAGTYAAGLLPPEPIGTPGRLLLVPFNFRTAGV